MMKDPLVSVVIPIFNGELLIRRCLDSIFSQSEDLKLELIVVDDGSTDKTVDLIRDYSHPIKLLQQKNQGPASARNLGIEHATGKFFAFLDADDYWLPGFLQKTVDFLEMNPEAVAVNTGQLHKIMGKSDKIMPIMIIKAPNKYPSPMLLDDFFSFWAEYNHVCTGSVLMRTDVVKQTGGQRPELRITEDLEFWAYLATFGKWGFIPEVLFVSDGGIVTRKKGWIEKNRKRWDSAPTVREWELRIIKRFNQNIPDGYFKIRGRIAFNLAYSMIQSCKDILARHTINENRQYLPNQKIRLLWLLFAKNALAWKLFCIFLRLREKSRIIKA